MHKALGQRVALMRPACDTLLVVAPMRLHTRTRRDGRWGGGSPKGGAGQTPADRSGQWLPAPPAALGGVRGLRATPTHTPAVRARAQSGSVRGTESGSNREIMPVRSQPATGGEFAGVGVTAWRVATLRLQDGVFEQTLHPTIDLGLFGGWLANRAVILIHRDGSDARDAGFAVVSSTTSSPVVGSFS